MPCRYCPTSPVAPDWVRIRINHLVLSSRADRHLGALVLRPAVVEAVAPAHDVLSFAFGAPGRIVRASRRATVAEAAPEFRWEAGEVDRLGDGLRPVGTGAERLLRAGATDGEKEREEVDGAHWKNVEWLVVSAK